MSYKSNDRVSGNRLSSFASQLWEKIKNTFALANHSHSDATTSASGFMSSTDKSKLDGIADNANNYSLPTASSTTLGGVKVGTNLSIDGNGVLSATDTKYTLTKDAVTALGDLTNNTSGNAAKATNAYYIGSTNNIHAFYTAESGHLCYATINNNGSIQWVKNIAQRDDNGNYDFKGNADTASRVKDLGGTSGNTIGFEYNGSGISKVSPSGNETRANSKYLVALTNDGGNSKYSWVDVNNVSIGGGAATATTANNLNTKTMLLQGGSSVPWYNVVEIGAAFANYRDVTATIGIQLKLRNSSGISSNYFCTANIGCRCNTGTEVLSAFCIVDGQIDLSDKFDLYVTASYYNGNAMVKLFVHVKDTDSKNYYQVNFVTLCKDDFAYSILYNDRSQSSKPTGTKTADAMWYDDIKGNAATATNAYGSTFEINTSGNNTGNCTVKGASGNIVLSSNSNENQKGIWLQAHGTATTGKWALVADTNNNVTLNGNASTASNVAWSGVTSKPNLHTGFQNTTNSGTLSNGGNFVTLSAYSNPNTATPTFTSTTYTLPTCHNNFTAATGTPTTLSPGQSFIALTGITGSTTASPTFVTTSYTLPGNCAVVFDYVGSDLNTIYCL